MWFRKDKPTILEPKQPPEVVQEAVNLDPSCWLNVQVALPEFNVRVLVHDSDRGVLTGHRTSQNEKGDTWMLGVIDSSMYSIYPFEVSSMGVTHWRAMPSPPVVKTGKPKASRR